MSLGHETSLNAALASGVDRVISISTDKAVNPANTMGATKLLAEKLIIDANEGKGSKTNDFFLSSISGMSHSHEDRSSLFSKNKSGQKK